MAKNPLSVEMQRCIE